MLFTALDHIHENRCGGNYNKLVLQRKSQWIFKLRAIKFPGLNDTLNFKPFVWVGNGGLFVFLFGYLLSMFLYFCRLAALVCACVGNYRCRCGEWGRLSIIGSVSFRPTWVLLGRGYMRVHHPRLVILPWRWSDFRIFGFAGIGIHENDVTRWLHIGVITCACGAFTTDPGAHLCASRHSEDILASAVLVAGCR